MAVDMFIFIETIPGEHPDPPPPPPSPPDPGTADGGTKKVIAFQRLDLATKGWISQKVGQIASTGSFGPCQRRSLIQEIGSRFGPRGFSGNPSLADIVCYLASEVVSKSQAQGRIVGIVVKSMG